MKIAFVKPPFYRLAGSHSNKVSVELSYWRGIAEASGHETMFYNGDQTGATGYWPWRKLMDHTHIYKKMIDMGESNPLLWEVAEAVMSWGPEAVVLSSYDSFMPSVALDSPWTCAYLARVFTKLGVPVIGVGAFFPNDAHLRGETRVTIKGGPSQDGLAEALRMIKAKMPMGSLIVDKGWQHEIAPCIDDPFPYPEWADYSYVATTKGCTFPCKFCYNTIVANRFEERDPMLVVKDLDLRQHITGKTHYYLTDQIFTRNSKRLEELCRKLDLCRFERPTFTVEARSELMNKGGEHMAKVMYQMGVRTAKMGVENTGDLFNSQMSKSQKEEGLRRATGLMRDAGIKVVAYLFLGGSDEKGYEDTIRFCGDMDFDGYVVSVWSHPIEELGTDLYRYDAHWSLARQQHFKIPGWAVDAFLKLQESKGGNKGLPII